ncbi:MAG: DUF1579 domain-containing protein [Phycisphaeraceae bacterium]|nr:DUF1579 domain-containing protein [Phycisphaeraceae bacterium]
MNRVLSRISTSCLALTVIAGASASLLAQQPDKKTANPASPTHAGQPAKEGADAHQQMMDAWMKLSQPGPEHKRIAQLAGSWDAEVKMFEPGSTQPAVSRGTMVNTLVQGDRYLHHEYSGEFMGQPFTGAGNFGFNNATKKYEGTWFDSMSTGIMYSTGTYNDATKTYTLTGEFSGPGPDGTIVTFTQRETLQVVSPDKHVMTMYHGGPGMPESKAMEITYTRSAGDKGATPASTGGVRKSIENNLPKH